MKGRDIFWFARTPLGPRHEIWRPDDFLCPRFVSTRLLENIISPDGKGGGAFPGYSRTHVSQVDAFLLCLGKGRKAVIGRSSVAIQRVATVVVPVVIALVEILLKATLSAAPAPAHVRLVRSVAVVCVVLAFAAGIGACAVPFGRFKFVQLAGGVTWQAAATVCVSITNILLVSGNAYSLLVILAGAALGRAARI